MKNVTTSISGTTLTIKIDLAAPKTPSKSGKSDILASTEGNVQVPGGDGLTLGLNLYVRK